MLGIHRPEDLDLISDPKQGQPPLKLSRRRYFTNSDNPKSLPLVSRDDYGCSCPDLEARLGEIEEQMDLMKEEVETAVRGMRSSLTSILRRVDQEKHGNKSRCV